MAVAIQFLLGFAGAAVLSRENKFTNFVRSLVLSPTVLTPLVVGLIWKALYQPDLGVISYYLRRLGVPIGRGLIVERSTALLAVILIDVWEWTPLVMLIILAGLKGLPKEPFEAAIIDGASRYHMLRYITLPLLRPIFLIALLMRSLDAIKVFDIIWATTGGGPGTVTTVANLRIYEVGINQLQIGYAAAMSNFLLVLSLSLGFFFVYILLSRKYTHESY
ncbi:MAG: sugar ABC transporter permease [Nitrososphaerota archaeon]